MPHSPDCPCGRCPKTRLACGCVRGITLCARAEALWDAVADAHKLLVHEHRLGPYELAMQEYNAHFAPPEEEPAVQLTF